MNFDYFYGVEAEQFSFYRIPKVLVKDKRYKNISMEAKFLYGLMLDRMSLSMKNGWFNKENQVYIIYTLEDIKEDMNCGNEKGVKVIAELEKIGLITRKKQGQGKPTIIYVKNFIKNLDDEEKTSEVKTSEKPKSEKLSAESQDFRKTEVKISENQKSRPPENRSQDFRKSECNNTNNNYINYNNNNYINNQSNQSSNINIANEKMIDTIDDTTYAELVKENILYNSYIEKLKDDDLELYKELYEIICEVINTKDETVRIGKHNYPYEIVKSQFLKLTEAHLEYVLECLKNTKSNISNIKAYLVTALYNSVNTIQNYYLQKQNVIPKEEYIKAVPEKNKFCNYEQRSWDFEELEKLEARLNDGIT